MKKTNIIILGIILLSFAIGIYFYPQTPEIMAAHWNAQGQVDGYIAKFWGLFLMPIISLGIFLLFLLIPKIDPLKKNIAKFRKYFDWFIVIIIFFLFYIYLLTIFWNIGFRFDMGQVLIPALAIFFYYVGLLLSKAKRNWFIGIKTPWTLSSDVVWEKTHQLGAKMFKITAIIILLGIFFPKYFLWIILGPVLFVAIYTIVYSYFEYQKQVENK